VDASQPPFQFEVDIMSARLLRQGLPGCPPRCSLAPAACSGSVGAMATPHHTSRGSCPLTFRIQGRAPGLMLVHGFGGDSDMWDRVQAGLATDHTVVCVDLPGFRDGTMPWKRAPWPPRRARPGHLIALQSHKRTSDHGDMLSTARPPVGGLVRCGIQLVVRAIR